MDAFHVWLSPFGATCKVRVDGITNANWLLNRLHQSLIFQSCEPVNDEDGSSCCTFRMTYSTQQCYRTFERLLAAIPELEWTLDPAREEDSKKGVTASSKTTFNSAPKVRRTIKASPSNKTTVFFDWLLSRLSRAVSTML
jgi:hypothetical protein